MHLHQTLEVLHRLDPQFQGWVLREIFKVRRGEKRKKKKYEWSFIISMQLVTSQSSSSRHAGDKLQEVKISTTETDGPLNKKEVENRWGQRNKFPARSENYNGKAEAHKKNHPSPRWDSKEVYLVANEHRTRMVLQRRTRPHVADTFFDSFVKCICFVHAGD